MFQNITYAPVFGYPLIMYLGIATLLSFLITGSIGFLNFKGIHTIPFKWHPRFAVFAICLAIIHGSLGVLAFF